MTLVVVLAATVPTNAPLLLNIFVPGAIAVVAPPDPLSTMIVDVSLSVPLAPPILTTVTTSLSSYPEPAVCTTALYLQASSYHWRSVHVIYWVICS